MGRSRLASTSGVWSPSSVKSYYFTRHTTVTYSILEAGTKTVHQKPRNYLLPRCTVLSVSVETHNRLLLRTLSSLLVRIA